MSVLGRLRAVLFPNARPDFTERDRISAQADSAATEQMHRADELMARWENERAEDLRRINRTGDFVYGWLVPEDRKESK